MTTLPTDKPKMPETNVRSATMPTAASSLSMSVGEFDFTALNLSEEWKRWKQRFEIFELASNFHKEDEKRRVAMLLHSMGESGIRIYNSFNLSSTEQYKYETVLQKFAGHFDAKCPITLTRHKFFTCKQKSDQSVSDFATELQNLSLPCKFGNLRLELVCDLFIAGLLDKKFQFMLLKEEAIDITKAVNMCKMAELSKVSTYNMVSGVGCLCAFCSILFYCSVSCSTVFLNPVLLWKMERFHMCVHVHILVPGLIKERETKEDPTVQIQMLLRVQVRQKTVTIVDSHIKV
ncbi:hypothetical protein M8J77_023427 [Diaphorina citri]|nr:hypothetical protein M8J77_023427 [Diaphorina citri]